MNNSVELKTMIDSQDIPTDETPENMAEAYLLAYRIQEGQKFFEYFNESSAKTPTPLVLDYMRSIGAPAISTVSATNIKDVLFEDLHRGYHKTAMLKGVAQAYLDICLFLGLASVCTGQKDLNYQTSISSVKASLQGLESGYERICDLFSAVKWSGDLKEFEQVATGVINFSGLLKTFEQSVKIVNLYINNKVKYSQSYDSILGIIETHSKELDDDLFFSHVVTVLRNKDSFTDEQISHVNEVYTNRFTDEQKVTHKANIPVETPDVSSTQAFFFKSKDQKNELADLV